MSSLTSPDFRDPDFRERLLGIQQNIAQQYHHKMANVSTTSGELNSKVATQEQPGPSNTAASQVRTEPRIDVNIEPVLFHSAYDAAHYLGVAQKNRSYYYERSDDDNSYDHFMSSDDDGDDKTPVSSDNPHCSRPLHPTLVSHAQSMGSKRYRNISPPTTEDSPKPKRIRLTPEYPQRYGLSDYSQQVRYIDDARQERLTQQQDTIHELQLQVRQLQEKDFEQSQELIRLRAQTTQSNTALHQIKIHQLRTNVRNLFNEAKARELVVQEYLDGWTRAKDEAVGLQAQLIDDTRKMGDMRKMVEALRKKSDCMEKELNRATKERDRVVNAVRRVLKFEATEKMASGEFGKFGEALMELKWMLPKERKNH